MQKTNGMTGAFPIKDKRGRLCCPHCHGYIKTDEYYHKEFVDGQYTKWHTWECPRCGAYHEHGHKKYGPSSGRYDDSAKECFRG